MSIRGRGGKKLTGPEFSPLDPYVQNNIALASTGHLKATLVLRLEGDSEIYNFGWKPNPKHLDLAYRLVGAFTYLTAEGQETSIDRLIQFLCIQQRNETPVDYKIRRYAKHYLGLKCTTEDFEKIGKFEDLGDRYQNMGLIYMLDPTSEAIKRSCCP